MHRLARIPIARTQSLIQSAPIRPFTIQAIKMSDKSNLDASKGSVGAAFNADGKVGEKAQQVGGPFDKDGGESDIFLGLLVLTSSAAVGKQFTTGGAVAGTAQSAAEQMQGDKKPLFDKDGAIGKQFQASGTLGSLGEAIGGPLSKEGGKCLQDSYYSHLLTSN